MHSWRVLILPYVDEQALFDRYRFDEPRDGVNNIKLLAEMPDIYRCPSHGHGETELAGFGFTNYLLLTGPESVFPGEDVVALEGILDGPSETAIFTDVNGLSVEWLRPSDLSAEVFRANLQNTDYVSNHPGLFESPFSVSLVGMADGSVHSVSGDLLTPATIYSITTRANGDLFEFENNP